MRNREIEVGRTDGGIGYFTILNGNVEIDANENAFVLEGRVVEIGDSQLIRERHYELIVQRLDLGRLPFLGKYRHRTTPTAQ
jgi:hypothetical protein